MKLLSTTTVFVMSTGLLFGCGGASYGPHSYGEFIVNEEEVTKAADKIRSNDPNTSHRQRPGVQRIYVNGKSYDIRVR